MREIELFALPDETLTDISLVEFPAIESNFLCFSKDEPKKYIFADAEKHIITGAVLIPDKRIYRNDMFGEYNVFFSKDTIRRISEQFFANFKNKSFTLDHLDNTNGVCVVESWIKDSEIDKSVELGLEAPVGTWFISAKVSNPNIWEGIKVGIYQGFSICGHFLEDDEALVVEEAENFIKNESNESIS